MSKAIILLSGGQDSVTCLYWAKINFDEVRAVSIFYGQRHASELDAARRIAELAAVPHEMLRIPALGEIGDSALVTDAPLTAGGGRADAHAPGGLPSSFVPGRNLLFLTLAAAVAVKHEIKDIVTGVCQTDYSGYPDCRRDFVDAFEVSAGLAMPSSAGPIRVHTPLMHMTKAETVEMAHRLGTDCWRALASSVTCYHGHRPGCGACPSCTLRAKGFADALYDDPANATA